MDTQTTHNTLTNFQKVQEFNESFGMTRHQTYQRQIFTENPNLVNLRLSLITEEVGELTDAIKEHDFIEVRDALADILYVVYGMADALGINADDDYAIVHRSNMSKLCNSEEEAIRTVENYQKKYESCESPYDSPYYTYLEKIGKWVVKNKSTGKVLKSINYTQVQFD